MSEKIKAFIKKWNMLDEQDVVIAGISGGADSVCLLFVLLELQKELKFQLVVVHVNHMLRGAASEEDEQFVKELCRQQKVQYVIYRENVELFAKNRKQSMEEAGRNVRRQAFAQTMKTYHGTKLALAHHQNDNAETLLLNLARGTGLKGLGGMRPIREHTIRPLLCLERKEIEQYLRSRQIVWREDATNETDDYTRNRIRHHLLPFMEQELNKNAMGNLNRTMEQLREMWQYADGEAGRYYEAAVAHPAKPGKGGSVIRKAQFDTIPEALRAMVLLRVLTEEAGQAKDLEAVHVNAVRELFDRQTGKGVDLPYGLRAVRCYEGVRIDRPEDIEAPQTDVVLQTDAESGEVLVGDRSIRWRIFDPKEEGMPLAEKSYTKWFDYDIIKKIVHIRTRQKGDYITIDKAMHTQKLKSYFVNEKISTNEREHILLIAEGSHILWIVGYRVSSAYQISKHTKRILEIQIDEGEEHGRNNPGFD